MMEARARAEVQRAVNETRTALSAMAMRSALAYPLMGICALIDRVEVDVTTDAGEDAFVLDEATGRVAYRVDVIERVIDQTARFADEIGCEEGEERDRLVQKAVNQFVVHELIHIKQNFPHFASVQIVKEGLPGFGVPIMDAAADVISAWTCANVECERLETRSEREILTEYVNALSLAYLVGAFVFSVRGRPLKIQRALGLVVLALLVQAKASGTLLREALFDDWREVSPLFVMNYENTPVFNVFVMDGSVGLLVANNAELPDDLAGRFWRSAGLRPLADTFTLCGEILIRLGVIRG